MRWSTRRQAGTESEQQQTQSRGRCDGGGTHDGNTATDYGGGDQGKERTAPFNFKMSSERSWMIGSLDWDGRKGCDVAKEAETREWQAQEKKEGNDGDHIRMGYEPRM